MKIWIDIVNTPHVRFFNGIIKKLRKDGHEVLITARDFSNIHDLLDIFGLEYTSIGDHGVTLEEKLLSSTKRAYDLSKFISKEDIDIAITKHSIELPRVAFGLGIPNIFILDNEHAIAANKLTLPLTNKLIIPEIFDVWNTIKFGMNPNNIVQYNGTCEITHLEDFKYNEKILETLNLDLDDNKKIILMRPEPSLASYLHTDCTKSVLTPIVNELKDIANILVIPRFKAQSTIFKDIPHVHVIKTPVDTFSLTKRADLLIGAGGTMNREAALLKTPVISCYPGKVLSVDKYYIEKGLMKRSTDLNEIIKLAKELLTKKSKEVELKTDNLIDLIVDEIYKTYKEFNK
ncbi:MULTISPECIES: DUF354 domain-containing protein [Methanosphaera]|uniref:DUF354 domain-containing protein n=1 Tax=Methanosphaera stadtmanae (strain ATCC 43021 / DSM 3091 / JCM 11832 / MCB-3) TaxID=339860 RepID=Q2NEZ3_METST|nr:MULTISPECIES: DUF354 domain-containing protein [Methanosphaera]ABC57610.1 conserved hypothetical protein [Methanosphaera stadtmanae DSM 3091]MDO5821972.1 DUF354 domain-containing protein [Methanosphaera sp.]OEC91655.1 hypothetical protein A9758_01725 [Methanosphaera sp. A6]RAP46485.1 MAG: hypothetical protein BZ132_05855 [Methanosphaera sp. DEW79]